MLVIINMQVMCTMILLMQSIFQVKCTMILLMESIFQVKCTMMLLMQSIFQDECEKSAESSLICDEPVMPVVNDHYSAKMSNLSLGSSTAEDKQDTESTVGKRTLKPCKSDSSLNVRDKTSSVSSDEGYDLQPSKATSKSNHELSTAVRNGPSHLPLEMPNLLSQVGYSVSPTRDGHMVPFTSYSSSEDEDDVEFFDADEYHELDSALSR